MGSSTGPTTGLFFEYRAAVSLKDDKHLQSAVSKEYVFYSRNLDSSTSFSFCAKGDSGSAVFDGAGRIVGLFFTGTMLNNAAERGTAGYVTPIEYVFQDIKDFSKGRITDIRIAQV
ncbi:hypothetical protein F66182_5793 [Fusarium sp. NRRL 66182]|nr:hypothetical protein F66182_5793 [Fusarium sp. NRRL 66182]